MKNAMLAGTLTLSELKLVVVEKDDPLQNNFSILVEFPGLPIFFFSIYVEPEDELVLMALAGLLTPISYKHCFKCQGLGHIASDYQNQKIIPLAEWETVKEEEKEDEEEEGVEEEEESPTEEVTGVDKGECLFYDGH